MAVTKLSGLGEITTNFLLNDVSVYIMNTSATGGYAATDWAVLGYTGPEKSINFNNEKYTREDKIPRVPTYTKTIRLGLEITCDLSNQNVDIDKLLLQGTKSSITSPTGTRVAVGTTQTALEYRAVRFVATRDDGVNVCYTIPKCEISLNGEKTMGGEEEVKTPLMFKAYYNSAANATANLFYVDYLTSGVSVTADVPPAYV